MNSSADDPTAANAGSDEMPGPSDTDSSTCTRGTEPSESQSTAETLLDSFRADGATVVSADAARAASTGADRDRGQSLYDWWSDREWLYENVIGLASSMRADTFDALGLEAGETVLDLACGPGTNFAEIREAVGPTGTVIGLDYSRGMTEQAIGLVDDRGWKNVHVVRADATDTCGPDGAFDAIVTTFALHTVPDAAAALENVRDALAPGGRFVVLDSRPITDGPARPLNPLYERVIERMVNHQRGTDTLELLEDTFEHVRIVETYDAGAGYLAVAKASADGS